MQIAPSLVQRFQDLGYQMATPKDGLGYRHNSDPSREDNQYIIVQAFDKQNAYADRPALPQTPRLARAYEQGILCANYG